MACLHYLYLYDVRERLEKDYNLNLVELVDDDAFCVFHDNDANLRLLKEVSRPAATQTRSPTATG